MATATQAPAKGVSRSPQRISSLKGTVPVRLLSLDMVYAEFENRGGVLPEEREKFYSYVLDLSPFVQKDVLHLLTKRIPPFEAHQIKAFESDALHLETALNSYLRHTAKSEFASLISYERYVPSQSVAARMRLAVRIYPTEDAPKKPDSVF
jgi:hypothetical protein